MKWFDLSDEERQEWRKNPATLAFFETVRTQIDDARNGCVSSMMNSGQDAVDDARRLAGRVDGLEVAINLMESDR